jgi:hypothetical protein
VNVGHFKARVGWVALLAIALLVTSLQAKLGLYHPEQSQSQLISKAFKLSECRLEPAVPDSPVSVNVVTAAKASDERSPDPDFQEYTPVQPRPILLSCPHWFRPPPARS